MSKKRKRNDPVDEEGRKASKAEEKARLFEKSKLFPKIVGVCYEKTQATWIATWRANGKTCHKYFSTSTLGFEEAYHRAVSCRITNIQKKKNLFKHDISALQSQASSENVLIETSIFPLSTQEPNTEEHYRLKMHKCALYCILEDLKWNSPRTVPHMDVDSLKTLNEIIDKHILNIWHSTDISQIQKYLDMFQPFLDLHMLPNTLDIKEQADYVHAIYEMPV
ncbi:conserved hypothetical protein [Theileria equi strain WA]|uniref:AP2/ERF domain-containing protein n=1 Tax=Theileria equi strain WA TaxID=1537102 RepID=L1LF59_THEEQ|nr:conserved hypothetical protein [Theileria equi strain WA]EKX74077.1 conserved hypothetical protein [Theileria equi strain WA]|eukprot:XP_004833529.1 conserved hypothetical protein [Theileria equi strain WA]